MLSFKYEGVSWNVESVLADGLTEYQFIQQGLREGQYKNFSDANQVKLLKEVYRLIKLTGEVGSFTRI